jgi:uncharacterized protein YcnI
MKLRLNAKWLSAGFSGLLAGIVLGVGVAQAHITVWPRESATNASELYTVRVPSEKPIATVAVRIEFPQDVTVSRFVAAPGWKREVSKDASGRIAAVTWSGGEIAPDEIGLLQFQARNPRTGDVSFKAVQTYSDKSVVEWTGPADAATPAAMVRLTEAPYTPADVTMAANIAQTVAAVYILDSSGFHDLDVALEQGQIPSGSLGRVQRAHAIAAATKWPEGLKATAAGLVRELGQLKSALEAGDAGAAAGPAHQAHEVGHSLSREAYAWLGAIGGTAASGAGEAMH